MGYINSIANLLTEDPDIFDQHVVLAVHPNYVIDAVVFASTDKDYGPKRLQMLKNYVNRFKRYLDGQINRGSVVIITTIGDAIQLDTWYDPENHYEDEDQVDPVQIGMEQEELHQIHQDILDYIYEKAPLPNVYVTSEHSAGEACRSGELNQLLQNASEINVIGGNLSGCLKRTVQIFKQNIEGPKVNILKELTFDDNEDFWKRISAEDYFD